jgi:hypothetical protein
VANYLRRLSLIVVVAVSWVALVALPARATNTASDPDDVGGRLDLRWVGVYRGDADSVRVRIALWDPVRTRMLPPPGAGKRQLIVVSDGLFEAGIYGAGYIYFDLRSDRWVLEWIDDGSAGVLFSLPVAHPDPYHFRFRFPAEHANGLELAEFATGILVVSCDRAPQHLPGCAPTGPGPPTIGDWIPSDPGERLDPAVTFWRPRGGR